MENGERQTGYNNFVPLPFPKRNTYLFVLQGYELEIASSPRGDGNFYDADFRELVSSSSLARSTSSSYPTSLSLSILISPDAVIPCFRKWFRKALNSDLQSDSGVCKHLCIVKIEKKRMISLRLFIFLQKKRLSSTTWYRLLSVSSEGSREWYHPTNLCYQSLKITRFLFHLLE